MEVRPPLPFLRSRCEMFMDIAWQTPLIVRHLSEGGRAASRNGPGFLEGVEGAEGTRSGESVTKPGGRPGFQDYESFPASQKSPGVLKFDLLSGSDRKISFLWVF